MARAARGSRLRRAMGWIARVLLVLGACVAGVALVAVVWLSTTSGKARILRWALAELDTVLPGQISIERLERLGPHSVAIRGLRITAKAGNPVVTAQKLEASVELSALLRGQLVISTARLENAELDLRDPNDPERGLLSAFVDLTALEVPPSEPASSFEGRIEQLSASGISVRLPANPVSDPLELRELNLAGRGSIGQHPAFEIDRLESQLWNAQTELGRFDLTARFVDTGEASTVALRAQLGDAALTLEGTARYQSGLDAFDVPLEAALGVRELTADGLARLLARPELRGLFLGPVGAQLQVSGTARDVTSTALVTTLGGAISVKSRSRDLKTLAVELGSDDLHLARVFAGLPDVALSTRAAGSLQQTAEAAPARMKLHAVSSLDHAPLPDLDLEGDLSDQGLHELELLLGDGASSVRSRGEADFDGRLHLLVDAALNLQSLERLAPVARVLGVSLPRGNGTLQVKGDLKDGSDGTLEARASIQSKSLMLEGNRIDGLDVRASAHGVLPFPRIALQARWAAVQRDDLRLEPGRLQVSGGPRRYQLEAHSGAQGLGALDASGSIERRSDRTLFQLRASGRFRDAPWSLQLRPTELLDSGGIRSAGAEVAFAGQRATLSGSHSETASSLDLDLVDVDLSQVLAPFLPESTLRGKVTAHVSGRGQLTRPQIRVKLATAGLGLAGRPGFDTRLKAGLDARSGTFELESSMQEQVGSTGRVTSLNVELSAKSQFEPGPAWQQSWLEGEHEATLELSNLESKLLSELLQASLPVGFEGSGVLTLSVHAGVPTLRWQATADVLPQWASPATKGAPLTSQHVASTLDYLDGRLATQLSLTDPAGAWLKLNGSIDVSEPGARPRTFAQALRQLPEALDALPAWLEQAAFELELDSMPRSTEQLPLPQAVRVLGSASVATHVQAKRQRGAEPEGVIEVSVTGAESSLATQSCSSTRLRAKSRLAFGQGKFQAELAAFDAKRQLVRVSSSGLLPFLPLVRGQSHVLSDLTLDAESQRLPLSDLPFLCQRLRGVLSATVHIEDPFGTAPRIGAEVALDAFSLGSEQTLDVTAKLAADTKQLSLDSTLTAEGKTSRIKGRLPLITHGRTVVIDFGAPVEGELALDALPVAPLIVRDIPISHVSGSLGGQVTLHGTLQAPVVAGRLLLKDMALTATALAQPLSNIQGEISFADDGIVIQQLSARDQGGTVNLDGRVTLRGEKRLDGLFNIAAHQFPLRQAGQVVATLSTSAQIRTALGTNDPKVWITLHDFDAWIESSTVKEGLDLRPHPDRVVERAPEAGEAEASDAASGDDAVSSRPFQKLTLYLDAGREFWIKRADFAIKLSANLQIILTGGGPGSTETNVSLTGQIQFDRGYLELLGKVFEVQKGGTLRFTGGADTTINLTAIYDDRRSDRKVKVHVTGSATAPRLDFALDDEPINAGEAFQAIYGTEDTSSDTNVDAQAQAIQFVSALTAGMLTTNLRRKLGAMAPILMIEPADSEGKSQLRAGFELDSLIPEFLRGVVTGMYVEGIVSSGKENETSGSKEVERGVLIELFFPYNLVTSGRYGPDTTWSLDFGWQP